MPLKEAIRNRDQQKIEVICLLANDGNVSNVVRLCDVLGRRA